MLASIQRALALAVVLSATVPNFAQDASAKSRPSSRPTSTKDIPLRSLAEKRKIHVGTCIQPSSFYPEGQELVAKEFNLLVAESHMKWDRIHPNKDQWNWEFADELVEFAQANKMAVKGHALIWHNSVPNYLKQLSPEALRQEVREHIQTVVGRYKGRVACWDVVNEALDDSGRYRKSIFLEKLGEDFIAECFQIAHEADPDAVLIYNDYGCEGSNRKSDAQFTMLKLLRDRRIPVHEVGFQMHFVAGLKIGPGELKENIERLTALGLKFNISEFDIPIATMPGNSEQEQFEAQARVYRTILSDCVPSRGFSGVTWWGYTDRHTWFDWLNRNNPNYKKEAPLLFDFDLKKKPAYYAVQEVLRK